MHPRVLALNFVNGRTNSDMDKLHQTIIDGFKEGSRYHGYSDPRAPAFLFYEIAKSVDLTDSPPPPNYMLKNSTKYPRKPMGWMGAWSFDYGALFNDTFAKYYDIKNPDDPSKVLSLCELFDRGIVHEVWIYGDADVPDVSAAEVLTNKQVYDADGNPIAGKFDRCAGNGCFDTVDVPKCGRTVRIGWVNNTRGPGCYLHSLGHDFERSMYGSGGAGPLPYLQKAFAHFANFDFKARGFVFKSLYDICSGNDCVSYPTDNSMVVSGKTIDPLDQGCGNVHFPPNARQHYDYENMQPVKSTCEHYGEPNAPQDTFTGAKVTEYEKTWGDCGGGWQVYWRQSFPGYQNKAMDPDGKPMKNWWPFYFY
jgi:hypothetical protein